MVALCAAIGAGKVECLFARLQNYRRIVVRYERYPENFLGMLHLACWLILMRCL
jgi:transposase